jgi:nucleoside-diphosphate-sugar epimerase
VKSEQVCREYIDKGLDITFVRPRTILGHGRLGIFQMLFEWIRQGRNVPVMGSGNNTFQFIHAHDLADATILAAEQKGSQIYNIGTDRFGTMRQALEALCRHAKTGSKVKSVPEAPVRWLMAGAERMRISPLGAYHYMAYGKPNYFDVSDAVSELGWHPKYSNDEMMIASYDWYVENRDAVLSSTHGSPHRSAVKQGVLKLLIGLL